MFRNPLADALVVIVIVLLFFGPKRLPELGKSLGSGLREFKDGITGGSDSDAERPELTRANDETATGASPAGAAPQAGAAASQSGTGATQSGAERLP